MAAEVSGNDDTWLYGDDDKSKNKENTPNQDGSQSPEKADSDKDIKENGEPSVPGEGEVDDDDSDSDSDDDDTVQVTIGDLKTSPAAYGYGSHAPSHGPPHGNAPVNVSLKRGPYQQGKPMDNLRKPAEGGGGLSTGEMVASSVDSVGSINGVSSLDFNLESLEEKEWRKPGADITDFFNYGFNEETWKLYCERQKRIRGETGANLGSSSKIISGGNFSQQQERKNMYNQRAPLQPRKSSGTIDVIGQNMATRRIPEYDAQVEHKQNTIQVMTGGSKYNDRNKNVNVGMSGPGIPDMSLPPPMFSMPPPPQQNTGMAVVPTYDSFSAAAAPQHAEFYGGGGGDSDPYYRAAGGGYDSNQDTQWHGAQEFVSTPNTPPVSMSNNNNNTNNRDVHSDERNHDTRDRGADDRRRSHRDDSYRRGSRRSRSRSPRRRDTTRDATRDRGSERSERDHRQSHSNPRSRDNDHRDSRSRRSRDQ